MRNLEVQENHVSWRMSCSATMEIYLQSFGLGTHVWLGKGKGLLLFTMMPLKNNLQKVSLPFFLKVLTIPNFYDEVSWLCSRVSHCELQLTIWAHFNCIHKICSYSECDSFHLLPIYFHNTLEKKRKAEILKEKLVKQMEISCFMVIFCFV